MNKIVCHISFLPEKCTRFGSDQILPEAYLFAKHFFFAKVSPRTDMRKTNTAALKYLLYFSLSSPPAESVPPSFAPCHPSSSSFDRRRAIARPKHALTERETRASDNSQQFLHTAAAYVLRKHSKVMRLKVFPYSDSNWMAQHL